MTPGETAEVTIGLLEELDDPGCREFSIGGNERNRPLRTEVHCGIRSCGEIYSTLSRKLSGS